MLRVSYVNPIGYVTTKTLDGKTQKLHLCTINDQCWAEIFVLKCQEKAKEYQLNCFFANMDHIKRCAKGGMQMKGYHYHFNTWNMGRSVNTTILKCLTQMGAKVSLYYKEYKKKVII